MNDLEDTPGMKKEKNRITQVQKETGLHEPLFRK
jgi:hypothetical protein